ncbi:hypothetical protein CLAIMM_07080, partial [Cladophialophora immunda]
TLIVSLIALAGAVFNILFASWFEFLSARHKEAQEAKHILTGYKGPLFSATQELQAIFWRILNADTAVEQQPFHHDLFLATENIGWSHVDFLFCQFLSWSAILRRETAFLAWASDKETRRLMPPIHRFEAYISFRNALYPTDLQCCPTNRAAFHLYRHEQDTISCLMIIRGAQLSQTRCMDFAEYQREHDKQDSRLRDSVRSLRPDRGGNWCGSTAKYRLILIQHTLRDLMSILDPARKWHNERRLSYWSEEFP